MPSAYNVCFFQKIPQSSVQKTAKMINLHGISLKDLRLLSCGVGDNPEEKYASSEASEINGNWFSINCKTRSSVTSPHGSCIKLHWTITNNNPTADTESTETPPQAFSFLPTLTIKTGVHQGNSVVLSSRWPQKRSYALPKSGSSKPGLNVADVGSWASPR